MELIRFQNKVLDVDLTESENTNVPVSVLVLRKPLFPCSSADMKRRFLKLHFLSSDYLVNRAEVTLGSIDKLQQSHLVYLGNRSGRSEPLVSRLRVFSVLTPFVLCRRQRLVESGHAVFPPGR